MAKSVAVVQMEISFDFQLQTHTEEHGLGVQQMYTMTKATGAALTLHTHTHTQVGSIQSGPNSAPCVSSYDYDDDDSLMPRTTSHYFLFSNLDITHSLFDFAPNFWIQFKTLQKRIYRPILECNNGNANQEFFLSLLSKRRHYYVSICM